MNGGIYLLRNVVNGRVYIGQTLDFSARKRHHFYVLREGKNVNPAMQSDFDAYGIDAFEFVPFCYAGKEQLIELEKFFIENFPGEKYNMRLDNNGFSDGFIKNTRSKEARKRAAGSLKKFYETDKGKVVRKNKSEEIKKHAIWEKVSPEKRKQIGSLGSKVRTENGYVHSDETKRKIGKGNTKVYDGAVSPTGEVFRPIVGMKKFCEEHDLNLSSMVAVMHQRRTNHRGWTKYNPEDK